MSNDKSSLGTGLDSLLGSRPDGEGSQVSQISVDELTPGQYQPRTKMHKSTLEELSQSIKGHRTVILGPSIKSACD